MRNFGDKMKSCTGCKKEHYKKYREPLFERLIDNDDELFKFLCLKIFEIGLSEKIIIQKQFELELAFDQFNISIVASYDENKINELLSNEKIIRHKAKIQAVIHNANQVIRIQNEYQSFTNFLWSFSDRKVLNYDFNSASLPSPLQFSTFVYETLKKEQFHYIGPKTILGFLHTIGIIQAKKVCIYKD